MRGVEETHHPEPESEDADPLAPARGIAVGLGLSALFWLMLYWLWRF
ncbi:MAG TPA: hypothetical protein VFK80_10080 [Limnochordia bacterium]|nr:hypothetical protein [Limnochordia bacterium]